MFLKFVGSSEMCLGGLRRSLGATFVNKLCFFGWYKTTQKHKVNFTVLSSIFQNKTTKSTLPGKVRFFNSGNFTGRSITFSKVNTLPGKVEVCSENQKPSRNRAGHSGARFFFYGPKAPGIYLDMFVWSLGAQRRARLNYFMF